MLGIDTRIGPVVTTRRECVFLFDKWWQPINEAIHLWIEDRIFDFTNVKTHFINDSKNQLQITSSAPTNLRSRLGRRPEWAGAGGAVLNAVVAGVKCGIASRARSYDREVALLKVMNPPRLVWILLWAFQPSGNVSRS